MTQLSDYYLYILVFKFFKSATFECLLFGEWSAVQPFSIDLLIKQRQTYYLVNFQWFKRMQYHWRQSKVTLTLFNRPITFQLTYPFFHDFIDMYFWYLELFPVTSTAPDHTEFLSEQWDLHQRWAPATLSHWPHQGTTQRNRNDSPFIIGRPLCLRGKSIIKTRLTAKIKPVSSIV